VFGGLFFNQFYYIKMRKLLFSLCLALALFGVAKAQDNEPLGSGWQVNYDVTSVAFKVQERGVDFSWSETRKPMMITRLGGGYRLNENFYAGVLFGIKQDDRDIHVVATWDMDFYLPLEKTKVVPFATVRWSAIFGDNILKQEANTDTKTYPQQNVLDSEGTATCGLLELTAGIKYPICRMVDFKAGVGYSNEVTNACGGFTFSAGIAVHAAH